MGGYRLTIFGCGGHARSIISTIYKTYGVKDVLLVDENVQDGERILGCRTISKYDLNEKDAFIVAIGDNHNRKNLYLKLNEYHKGCCISVISKDAEIGVGGEIGVGTFLAPYAYIGTQAKVGNNTIINTGSIIEHEAMIGDHTHIAPHVTICGRSKVGNNVFCGSGSTVIDKISICDNVIIGAGAVVIDNIVEAGTYVGIPAKRIS